MNRLAFLMEKIWWSPDYPATVQKVQDLNKSELTTDETNWKVVSILSGSKKNNPHVNNVTSNVVKQHGNILSFK
jgi:hypothetical protein